MVRKTVITAVVGATLLSLLAFANSAEGQSPDGVLLLFLLGLLSFLGFLLFGRHRLGGAADRGTARAEHSA